MSQPVQGRVIERESGEGVPEIPVTNGESIVLTGPDGSFSIDLGPQHRFVYLSTPETHDVDGLFYKEASSLRADPHGADFHLVAAPEKASPEFTFVQISDIHVIETQSFRSIDRNSLRFYSSRETLAMALHQIEREAEPAFIVPTGDLTHRGSEVELSSCRDAMRTVDTPVLALYAGHDGSTEHFENGKGKTSTRVFEGLFGPTCYSFDRGGKHFVLYADEDLMFSEEDRERKKAWLNSDLSMQPPDRDIYVFVHCPPTTEFLESLAQYNVKMVMYGHYHASKLQRFGDIDVVGTPPVTFAGMDTSPRGYRWVQCNSNGHRIDFCPLSLYDVAGMSRAAAPVLRGNEFGRWQVRWKQDLPVTSHRAAPVAADGVLLLSQQDETHSGHDGVLALNADSGELLYHVATETSVKNSAALVPDTGSAAALTIAGRLHLFDTKTGETRWTQELPGHPMRYLYTTPVAVDRIIYAGGKAGCGAFATEDGSLLWYTPLEGSFDFQPCFASPQVFGDLLVVSLQGKGMAALRRSDGAVEWQNDFRAKYQSASAVVAGDLLATGGNYTDLGVLWGATGEVVWQFPYEHKYVCALAADEGSMYAGTPTGELQCYDLQTGELRWTFRTGDDLMDFSPYQMGVRTILATPVLFNGHLLLGSCDGWLYILDPETGACLDQTFFGAPITSAPCAAGDRIGDQIYIATYDRKVYCLERTE